VVTLRSIFNSGYFNLFDNEHLSEVPLISTLQEIIAGAEEFARLTSIGKARGLALVDAEEIASKAQLKALEKLPSLQYRSVHEFTAWRNKIHHDLLFDYQRKRTDMLGNAGSELVSPSPSPRSNAETNEALTIHELAMNDLTEQQRQLLYWAAIKNMTAKEIVDILPPANKVTEAAVHQQLKRARDAYKRALKRRGKGYTDVRGIIRK
jgi:RNA polymerase sigma factor (sigma-70 family)